jgi:hypothetical protein
MVLHHTAALASLMSALGVDLVGCWVVLGCYLGVTCAWCALNTNQRGYTLRDASMAGYCALHHSCREVVRHTNRSLLPSFKWPEC